MQPHGVKAAGFNKYMNDIIQHELLIAVVQSVLNNLASYSRYDLLRLSSSAFIMLFSFLFLRKTDHHMFRGAAGRYIEWCGSSQSIIPVDRRTACLLPGCLIIASIPPISAKQRSLSSQNMCLLWKPRLVHADMFYSALKKTLGFLQKENDATFNRSKDRAIRALLYMSCFASVMFAVAGKSTPQSCCHPSAPIYASV